MGGYMSARRMCLLWRDAQTGPAGRAQTIVVCFFFQSPLHGGHMFLMRAKRVAAREWEN